MKKVLVCMVVFSLAAVYAWGANFAPTPLRLVAPSYVQYDFDGKDLTIPLTVSGTPATVVFCVYTKDKEAGVNTYKSGFLGWHYVNKIDTCVYVSSPQLCATGSNSIRWNGKTNHRYDFAGFKDSGNLAPGDYTYYLWGYDGVSKKTHVTKHVPYGWVERGFIVSNDKNGKPLSNPIIYHADYQDAASKELKPHTNYKWVIGNDPLDQSLLETCVTMDYAYGNTFTFHPDNPQVMFNHTFNNDGLAMIRKWKWVPNGNAEQLLDWGESGKYTYNVKNAEAFNFFAGVVSDGGDYLFTTDGDISGNSTHSDLLMIDVDKGTLVRKIDLTNFWTVDFSDMTGSFSTEGPNEICIVNGRMLLGTMWSWEIGMIDPYVEAGEEPHLWFNSNGDGVCDMIKGKNQWGLDARPYEQKWRSQMDGNLFTTTTAYDLGAVTFGLIGPDGTGIGYFAAAGEVAGVKMGETYVQNGSAFDGMYIDDNSNKDTLGGWFWLGHDSIKGVISNKVSVTAIPSAFEVEQNIPNPFNPSTTISFKLAEAGKTRVDVFNIAGQKVATLANGLLNAGSHSVAWNASNVSAGVYFYTVKSGDFSKTMKMTLIK